MKWGIYKGHLEKLLPFRDILNWKRIENKTSIFTKDETIKLMSQVEYPLKVCSISVDNISEEVMKNLCAMGSTIEILKLSFNRLDQQAGSNMFLFSGLFEFV